VIYPNSTPEFRFLVKENGVQVLQVRYINIAQGYISKWADVPLVKEEQNG
jgi:hypothetical protein